MTTIEERNREERVETEKIKQEQIEEQYRLFMGMFKEIHELKKEGWDSREIFDMLLENSLLPAEVIEVEKIVYVPQPLKTSPEELAWIRECRKRKKEAEALENEEERIEYLKEKALSNRKTMMCWGCNKHIPCKNAVAEVVLKNNETKRKIIITNTCEKCGTISKCFGCWVDR